MPVPLRWRRCLPGQVPAQPWRDWLTEPASLTARCQRHCRAFSIRVIRQCMQPEESANGRRTCRPTREVLLLGDGEPWIYACSSLSGRRAGPLGRWFSQLGSRSLGSLLFCDPRFRRDDIEFARLAVNSKLHRRIAKVVGSSLPELWVRRSRHHCGPHSVSVIEVFLPSVVRQGVLE